MAFHVQAKSGVLGPLCAWPMLELQDHVLCWGYTKPCDGRCDAPSSYLGTEAASFTDEAKDRGHCCSYDGFVVSFILNSNGCGGVC